MSQIAVLIDKGGQTSRMTIDSDTATGANVKSFLDTYSLAGFQKLSKITTVAMTPTAAQVGANVDKKVRITYRDNTTHERGFFVVPAYKGLTMKATDKGDRVDETSGQAICNMYKTKMGLPHAITFIRGTPTQRI
jgi:hypothetical protein